MLFNRSWYNRASVERVMGFCSKAETEEFLETVPQFEAMLIRGGITVTEILSRYHSSMSRRSGLPTGARTR